MLPTLVFVALPAETTALDTETLLAACNQTYIEGECRAGARPDLASSLAAEVRWVSDGHAQVHLRFTLRDTQRDVTRSLEFRTEDDLRERFRSLGFVVGSLAGTATELSRQEEESAAPAPISKPEATKLDPSDAPAEAPPRATAVEIPTGPGQAREIRGRIRLGVQSGLGVESLRWGGSLGASAIWNRLWLLDLHGAYSREDGEGPAVDANFVELGLGVGFESQSGSWAIGLNVGPRLVQVHAESGLQEDSLPAALGAQLAFNLRYVTASLSPYLELDGIVTRPDRVLLDDRRVEFEPVQVQVSIGFAFADLTLD